MGRPLRQFCPKTLYFVRNICRNFEARFKPTAEIRDMVNGLLAKHAQTYQLEVVAYTFMPGEFLMLTLTPGRNLQLFMRDFQRDLSTAMNRVQGMTGGMMARRYEATPVLADMQEEVLAEIISRPCDDELVSHPADWSGASSWPAHQSGGEVVGYWSGSDDYWKVKRRKGNAQLSEKRLRALSAREYRLKPAKLPLWEELDEQAYTQKLNAIAEAAARRRRANWEAWRLPDKESGRYPEPPGIERVLSRPVDEPTRRWEPASREACLTRSSATLWRWEKARRAREKLYKSAAKKLREQRTGALFPVGMIPPGHLYCVGSAEAIRLGQNPQAPAQPAGMTSGTSAARAAARQGPGGERAG